MRFPVTIRVVDEIGDELDIDEIIEDESSVAWEIMQNSDIKTDNGEFLREIFVKRTETLGYDMIIISDYTDGDDHESYIVLDADIIN